METHLFNLVFYAVAIGALFSLFLREGRGPRLRFAVLVALSMVGAAIAAGFLMDLGR